MNGFFNQCLLYLGENFVTVFCISILAIYTLIYKFEDKKIKNYFILIGLIVLFESIRSFAESYVATLTSGYGIRIYLSCIGYIIRPAIFYLLILLMERNKSKNIKIVFSIPLVIVTILMILTPFTGDLILSFPNNEYHPTNLLNIAKYSNLLYLAIVIVIAIRKNKNSFLESIIIIVDSVFILINYINEVIVDISSRSMQNDIIALSILVYYMFFRTQVYKQEIDNKKLKNDEEKILMERNIVDSSIETISYLIDARDKNMKYHSLRVAKYSALIAKNLGYSSEECRKFYLGGLVHDVGKIYLSDQIINKQDKYTSEELAQYMSHPMNGAEILKRIEKMPYLQDAALYHHAYYDGTGYPKGISGDKIPEIARIVAVADNYEHLTNDPNKCTIEDRYIVRNEMWKLVNTQLDPKFVKSMIALIDADSNFDLRTKNGEDSDLILIENEIYKNNSKKKIENKNSSEIAMMQMSTEKRFAEFVTDVNHWITPQIYFNITNEDKSVKIVSKSNEFADKVWHVPAIIIYSSSDGILAGEDYIEYCVIKGTGYGWNVWPAKYDKEELIMNEKFTNWDEWFKKNKSGMNYSVDAILKNNVIYGNFKNEWFNIKFEIGLPSNSQKNIFIALSGESCTIKERK